MLKLTIYISFLGGEGRKYGKNGPKLSPKLNFSPLFQVWFISFSLNAHNDSLEQCLTTSTGNSHKKFGGKGQIWAKRTKIRPKIRFLAIFLSLVHLFSFKLHRMLVWNNFLLLVEVKLRNFFLSGPKLGLKLGFLPYPKACIISFPCYCTGLQLGTMSNIWLSWNLKNKLVTQLRT